MFTLHMPRSSSISSLSRILHANFDDFAFDEMLGLYFLTLKKILILIAKGHKNGSCRQQVFLRKRKNYSY